MDNTDNTLNTPVHSPQPEEDNTDNSINISGTTTHQIYEPQQPEIYISDESGDDNDQNNKAYEEPNPNPHQYDYFVNFIKATVPVQSVTIIMATLTSMMFNLTDSILDRNDDVDRLMSISCEAIGQIVLLCLATNENWIYLLPYSRNYMAEQAQLRNRLNMAREIAFTSRQLTNTYCTALKSPWVEMKDDNMMKEMIISLTQKIIDTVNTHSIHGLFIRNIERLNKLDRLTVERNIQIMARPHLDFSVRSHSIYPILYTFKKKPSEYLASLLNNAGVEYENTYMHIEEVAYKLYNYLGYLSWSRFADRNTITRAVEKALGHKETKIDIFDNRTYLYPLRKLMKTASFITCYNMKYPNIQIPNNPQQALLKPPSNKAVLYNEWPLRHSLFEKGLKEESLQDNFEKWMHKSNEERRMNNRLLDDEDLLRAYERSVAPGPASEDSLPDELEPCLPRIQDFVID
jgi:hypothetical protein